MFSPPDFDPNINPDLYGPGHKAHQAHSPLPQVQTRFYTAAKPIAPQAPQYQWVNQPPQQPMYYMQNPPPPRWYPAGSQEYAERPMRYETDNAAIIIGCIAVGLTCLLFGSLIIFIIIKLTDRTLSTPTEP